MRYLKQLKPDQLKNKTCLLRVDLNIQDADLHGYEHGFTRISLRMKSALPTIYFLLDRGAKVVILSHRGRPKIDTRYKIHNTRLSLKPFAKILSQLLKKPVYFVDDFNFLDIREKVNDSKAGSVFLLENLRFFPEEEKNDQDFAKSLASLGDIFINDAFAVSHRKNASVEAIAKFLPSYAGLLLEKEIKNLDSVMKNPTKPLVVILGGAKVSDKICLINNFLKKADYFLVGGAMANTFFALQGLPVGDSLCDKDIKLTNLTPLLNRQIILPSDVVTHKRQILDIGPKTIKKFQEVIKKAETIIWNGPMGMFENKKFAKGTGGIAAGVLKNKKAKIVIGGGETVASLNKIDSRFKIHDSRIFISTGGGAMLEYLAGKKLPGLKALNDANPLI